MIHPKWDIRNGMSEFPQSWLPKMDHPRCAYNTFYQIEEFKGFAAQQLSVWYILIITYLGHLLISWQECYDNPCVQLQTIAAKDKGKGYTGQGWAWVVKMYAKIIITGF